MTVLATDTNIMQRGSPILTRYVVKAATTIYKGSLVSLDATGYAIASADTAGTVCVGVAAEHVVQDSLVTLKVGVLSGAEFLLISAAATQANVGGSFEVGDSGALALPGGSTNGVVVGRGLSLESATMAWVFIPAGGADAAVFPSQSANRVYAGPAMVLLPILPSERW